MRDWCTFLEHGFASESSILSKLESESLSVSTLGIRFVDAVDVGNQNTRGCRRWESESSIPSTLGVRIVDAVEVGSPKP